MCEAAIPYDASLPRKGQDVQVPFQHMDVLERPSLHSAMYPRPASRPVPGLTFSMQAKKKPAHRTGMLIWWAV